MDATRLRSLIEGALSAQSELEASERARREAETAVDRARERHRIEVGNLRAAIGAGCVIFGENLVRVGHIQERGEGVILISLATVPVVAPPPAPLPEADPPVPRRAITAQDMADTAKPKSAAPPLAAGKAPTPKTGK